MLGGEGALRQEEGNKEACGHKRGADDKNLVQGVAKGVENARGVVILLLAQLLLLEAWQLGPLLRHSGYGRH
mgnify:CR=1 FL=1